jgi:hypothetical protein
MLSVSDLPTLNASLDATSAVLLAAWTLPLRLYAVATGVDQKYSRHGPPTPTPRFHENGPHAQ